MDEWLLKAHKQDKWHCGGENSQCHGNKNGRSGDIVRMIKESIVFFVVLFLFFIFMGTVMMYIDKKKFCKEEEDSFYYGYSSKRKLVREKTKVDKLGVILFRGYTMLIIFVLGFCIGLLEEIRPNWNGMGIYVDKLVEIMFTMWMGLMGVLVVFVSFMKKTWLTFSADDIVKRFGIKDDVVRMGEYILVNGFIQFFKPILLSQLEYQWYFGLRFLVLSMFVAFMVRFLKLSYLLIESFFGNKMEQIFLDSLYEELWFNPVKKINLKDNWEDNDTIKLYVNYLIDRYLLASKKIKIANIHKIGFSTNLFTTDTGYKGQRYKKVKRRSILCLAGTMGVIMTLLVTMVCAAEVMNKTISLKDCIISGMSSIVFVFVVYLLFGAFSKSFALFAIVMTNGRCSYEIEYEKDSKKLISRRFVREVAFFERSNYFQFVHVLESIVAFFLIAPEKAKPVIYEELSKNCLNEINGSKICLPIVVLDYLNYIAAEKKLLPYQVEIADIDLAKRLMRAFGLDIGRRCFDYTEEEGISAFEDYITDRKGKE